MHIVILHRLPYSKIRYDLAIDHTRHIVHYLHLPGGDKDLPSFAIKREVASFDAAHLAAEHADWLSQADRLIARSEYELLAAAELREHFAIPGDTRVEVLPLRDKLLMREQCAAARLRQPGYWSAAQFRTLSPRDGLFVLKPRLEASSTGIIKGPHTAINAAIDALATAQEYLVEAFIPGKVCHLDGFMREGEIGLVVSSHYVGSCLEYAGGTPLGSAQVSNDPPALSLLQQTLNALGQRNGCFHFEAILDEQGHYWFLETACRVGGAGVAETVALRTGINLYQIDLEYQLNGTIERHVPTLADGFYGWFVYPAHHCADQQDILFEPERWQPRLHNWHHMPPAHVRYGSISYATGATPLSGVVQGSAQQVHETLQAIFRETRIRNIP